MTIQTLSYDDFIEQYAPVENHIEPNAPYDGRMFETYGDELAYVQASKPENVWTLLESDGVLTIASGFHFVNRLGYFISNNICPENADIEVTVSDHFDIGESYAEQFLQDDMDDRSWLASTCEEQGIIAAAVCFHLMKQGQEDAAKRFINAMIGRVQS